MSDYYDRDKFTGGGSGGQQNPPPPPPHKKPDNNAGWYTWPIIIILFATGVWPVALILLFVNIFGGEKSKGYAGYQGAVSAAERAARQAANAMEKAGRRAGQQAESAVEKAMRRAEERMAEATRAAERMTGQPMTIDEMAKALDEALDRAKARAARERELARTAQQSSGTPNRSGYADARPAGGPPPKPVNPGRKENAKPAKEKKPKKQKLPGKGLRNMGLILLALGGIMMPSFLAEAARGWVDYDLFFTALSFLAGGGIMFGRGGYLVNMTRRSQRYILAIGNVDAMPMDEIAKRVNRKPAQAAKELQKLIDKGYLGEDAYIDRERGYFLRFGATLEHDPDPQPVEEEAPFGPPETDGEEGYATVLQNIRRANQRIADPELSRKIARIEQVTERIFKEVEEHPEKRERIHTFFDYYLPTTQKLLDAYVDFEATGVEGANLRQAKARIKQTMDAIVDGFERQLDHLYSSDAMDVVTDIKVMEAMLNRDGASASRDFGYHETLRDGEEDDEEDGGFRPLQL